MYGQEGRVSPHRHTAKHVAEAIEPAEAVLAINGKDGLPLYLRTGNVPWFYHPTEKDCVDVAVMQFGSVRFNDYDISWIPEDIFVTGKELMNLTSVSKMS